MDNQYTEIFSSVLDYKQIKIDEPMRRHTTFGIGGPADCFLTPKTAEELCVILKLAYKHHLPVFTLGGGANLLVRDKGIRGVVIYTGCLHQIEQKDNFLKVSSGVSTADVAQAACMRGLSGMEFASGIPGTIGGAAYMEEKCPISLTRRLPVIKKDISSLTEIKIFSILTDIVSSWKMGKPS